MESHDDVSIELIEMQWDLLKSVLSPLAENLPSFDPSQPTHINEITPLIRSHLECIGNQLDPQIYLPSWRCMPNDTRREICAAYDKLLEKLEDFVKGDIMLLNDAPRPLLGEKPKFPRLQALRDFIYSTYMDDQIFQGNLQLQPRNYVTIMGSSETSLSILCTRMQYLFHTVSKAFPRDFSDTHLPPMLNNSIEAARRAQDFGSVAETLFNTLARQMDNHCEKDHDGFIRLEMLGKSHIDMLLPTCSKDGTMHPTSFALSMPSPWTTCPRLDPSEPAICMSIRDSFRRQQKLELHFQDERLWQRDMSHKQKIQLGERLPLSNLIMGYDGESGTKPFTLENRAKIPLLLAHSMLHLYNTQWLQHYWDMEKVSLWKGKDTPLQIQNSYLACLLSTSQSKRIAKSMFIPKQMHEDILYRHILIQEFGLRLLEIECGKHFPPDLEQDRDPESDENTTVPFLTLNRVLTDLKEGKHKGQIEDGYLDIADACLNFDHNLKKIKSSVSEPGLLTWVAIHKFIFLPLLNLLSRRFKEAAADFFDLEEGIRNSQNTGTHFVRNLKKYRRMDTIISRPDESPYVNDQDDGKSDDTISLMVTHYT
ncbi:hypothetical protein F4805DRAFT_458490 [Annulohypoxylon moriforme]|nr:hypothetical protein F4805DRAFT_458490 [Annulohypoxylon moriforme]